jgi:hypothetical protein
MSSQSHNTRISVPKARRCRSSWAELVQVRAARAVHDAATAAPPAHRRRRRKDQLLRHRSGRHLCCAVAATITSHCCAAEVNVSKLCRDGRFHHLTPPRGHQRRLRLRGRRTRRSELAHLRTDGCHWDAEALNPLAKVGRHTDPDFMARRLQVRRKRQNRLDIAT